MAKRNIGKEIIQGLEEIKAWKQGKAKLKTYAVELPRAADVAAIRKELGLSQDQFALFMGVSVATLRNWEQERREPQGPARSLLLVAAKQPRAVRAAFKSVMPAPRIKAYAKAA
jgi:putative transcriptional regulator